MHEKACGDSSSRRCRCGCEGALHGWKNGMRVAFVAQSNADLAAGARTLVAARHDHAQATHAGTAITDFLVARAITWAAEGNWTDSKRETALRLVRDGFAKANETILDAVDEDGSISARRRRKLRITIEQGHLLCTMIVAVLKLQSVAEKAMDDAIDEVATALTDALIDEAFGSEVITAAVKAAIQAALKAAVEQLTPFLSEDQILGLRLAGTLICPDWTFHTDNGVWVECVKPLFVDAFTDAEVEWLEGRMKDFPFE